MRGSATFVTILVQTFVALNPAKNLISEAAFISFANGFIFHTSRRKISIRKANVTHERLLIESDTIQTGMNRHTDT